MCRRLLHWRDDLNGKPAKWRVAVRCGKINSMPDGVLKELWIKIERTAAQIRTRVEHLCHTVTPLFGRRKVRDKEGSLKTRCACSGYLPRRTRGIYCVPLVREFRQMSYSLASTHRSFTSILPSRKVSIHSRNSWSP